MLRYKLIIINEKISLINKLDKILLGKMTNKYTWWDYIMFYHYKFFFNISIIIIYALLRFCFLLYS